MKYIVFKDGSKHRLVDVTYDNFVEYHDWSGVSDSEYAKYKLERNMYEIDDFNEWALNEGYTIEDL